ncbi:MAG: dipeptidase [Chloroflexota bacterium]
MNTAIPIIDGHNDTLLRLYRSSKEKDFSFITGADRGHLDLPKAVQGNLGGGFFAIYTPSPAKRPQRYPGTDGENSKGYELPLPEPLELSYAQQFTLGMAARLFQLEKEGQGRLKIVRAVSEMEQCLKNGTFAMIFHIEGAGAIDTDLDMLHVLYEAGLRSLGITWSRPTIFGYGVPFKFPSSPDTGDGLTEAGFRLVKACNELGILIDLSHLNEKGFWDVEHTSNAPLVATHSGVHNLCPSARNLTDKQIDAVGQSGGIIGVNFHVGFLRKDGANNADTPLSDIVAHATYIVDRIGIEHVALGSDFDGATMPNELGSAAGLPKLMQAFSDAGYDEAALRKIAHENWVRVLGSTWK